MQEGAQVRAHGDQSRAGLVGWERQGSQLGGFWRSVPGPVLDRGTVVRLLTYKRGGTCAGRAVGGEWLIHDLSSVQSPGSC